MSLAISAAPLWVSALAMAKLFLPRRGAFSAGVSVAIRLAGLADASWRRSNTLAPGITGERDRRPRSGASQFGDGRLQEVHQGTGQHTVHLRDVQFERVEAVAIDVEVYGGDQQQGQHGQCQCAPQFVPRHYGVANTAKMPA